MAAGGFLARLHGRTAAGVPRWAVRTAFAVTLAVLPSSLWRVLAFLVDLPIVERIDTPEGHGPILVAGNNPAYIIGLSVLSETLAFLAFGLVCRWGEVFPRWIPFLGGRRVPAMAAVIPGAIGSAVLMVFPYALVLQMFGRALNGSPAPDMTTGFQTALYWLAYGPLLLWGPMMAVLTVHYLRRRRTSQQFVAAAA